MSNGRLAFLFPGQGSQYSGMGVELGREFPVCRAAFDEADTALGEKLSELCFNGAEADLNLTQNTQPAVLTVGVAAARLLEERGIRPEFVAGHSLGEYAASVCAGAMTLADAVRVVRNRGRYMQEAVPVGEGSMAAIIGMEAKPLDEVCAEAARGQVVVPANYNSPGQTVIAGHTDAVRRAVALAEARGARKTVMLPVSAPFHSPLMEPARQRLEVDLRALELNNLRVPLVSNVDAAAVESGADLREALIRQVTSPVRFTEVVEALASHGVGTVVEVGPGRVLSGLVRRIARGITVLNVEDAASLDRTLASLGESS